MFYIIATYPIYSSYVVICNQTIYISNYYVGAVLGARAFDTYGQASAGKDLRDYLNSISGE